MDRPLLCWYCQSRDADQRVIHMLKLRRDERYVWFVVGTYERWRTGTIGIPRCFPCKRVHWIYQLHRSTLTCSGCLMIPLGIMTLLAAVLDHDYFGFRILLPIAVTATLLHIPTRLYVRRHPRNEPEEYPPLAELIRQGWRIT